MQQVNSMKQRLFMSFSVARLFGGRFCGFGAMRGFCAKGQALIWWQTFVREFEDLCSNGLSCRIRDFVRVNVRNIRIDHQGREKYNKSKLTDSESTGT